MITCSAGERTRSSPLRPSSSANSRKTSSPNPWNVRMTASFSPIGVLMSTRSCISAAARSVNVTARISCGLAAPEVMRWTMRAVSTWVFPVPAPATTRRGPKPCSTASLCSGWSPWRMSGRGSPRRKLSCSVISGDLERRARPDRNPLYAAADPPASGPSPGAVPDVGHLTLDLVAVLVGEWHGPHAIARRRSGLADDSDERVRLAEQTTEMLAQADRDRAGQGCHVDHALCAFALGVGDPVDQDEPALGIRVDHLDGLPAHRREHISGLGRTATGEILGARRHADHVHLETELPDGGECRDDRGRAGHVGFHVVHVVGGLDRDPAGIEGDALPHQTKVVPGAASSAVTHDDEAGWLVAALCDRQEATHPESATTIRVQDLDADSGFFRELLRRLGDKCWRHSVGRLVRQATGHVRGIADGRATLDRVGHGLLGDKKDLVDVRKTPLLFASAVRLRSPHPVDRALDRGLRRPLLTDRVRRDGDADFAHRRSPERAGTRAGDGAGGFRIELPWLAGAHDDHTRLLVERVHAVEPGDPLFFFEEPGDSGARRTREPRRWLGAREERDDDRVDLAELRRTNGAKSHGATFFRSMSVATRSRACSGPRTRMRSSPDLRVSPRSSRKPRSGSTCFRLEPVRSRARATVIVPVAASSVTIASAKRATASGRNTASVPMRIRSPRSASAATSSRSRPYSDSREAGDGG